MNGYFRIALYSFAALLLVSCAISAFSTARNSISQRLETSSDSRSTATPAPTATVIPTATPTPKVELPLIVVSADGWRIEVLDMQYLDKIETSTKRFRPNGVYLVLLAELTNGTDSDACIRSNDFELHYDDISVQPVHDLADKVKGMLGGKNYPGSIQGQCLNYDEVKDTFLLFDAPRNEFLWLGIKGTLAPLGIVNEFVADLEEMTLTVTAEADTIQVASTAGAISTIVETPTAPPTATVARVALPKPTETPTPIFSPTATLTPTPIPTSPKTTGRVVSQANLRSGPGTDYEVVGGMEPSAEVVIVGSNAFGDWYQLENQMWIASFLIEAISGVVPTLQPSPTPTNTPVPSPTQTPLPTATSRPLLPDCYEIKQLYRTMTDAQWEFYSSRGVKDNYVTNWQGVVRDVGDWSVLIWGYPLSIEIEPDCQFYFVIDDESEALELSLGQEVIVSGRVDFINEFWGIFTIHLDEERSNIRWVAK